MMPRFSLWRCPFFPRAAAGFALFLLGNHPVALDGQGPPGAVRERILLVEDRRARGPGDTDFLSRTARTGTPAERAAAIRALGRLEDPRQIPTLMPLLAAPEAEIRREALHALVQALQAFRRDTISLRGDDSWSAALDALGARAGVESDPAVAGALAVSLGRLPYRTDAERLEGERRIRLLLERLSAYPAAATLAVRGAETIRRARDRGPRVDDSLTGLLRAIVSREPAPGWEIARRRALGALLLTGPGERSLLGRVLTSTDPELRRLAVSGLEPMGPGLDVLRDALRDPAVIVRREVVRSLGKRAGSAPCASLATALADRDEGTWLLALDVLGTACADTAAAIAMLRPLSDGRPPAVEWRPFVHALVALARLGGDTGSRRAVAAAAAPVWQVRMYAARAAQSSHDTALLARLAADTHPNVREAAITGLRALEPRGADAAAIQALRGRDYQLLRTAADALEGAGRRQDASRALADALDRVSADGAETSRDTRLALIARLRETGSPALALRLRPRLRDFDPVVADSAAALLSAWTGRPVRATPRPRPPAAISLREVDALRGTTLRIVMATGDTIDAELLTEEAPLTAVRVARLARRRYYDGLTFHRVAPNFVIQGGSPGANEYAGDGPYMRDELTALSHERGTFGISTRGRDTGDAQLFVNLVDNPRLDFDYTVWARVTRGVDALDRVGEGDTIRRLQLLAR